ncbi:peroxin [Tulasnella sp. 418]|nr:peroxin [Tulasnella sp. 418]
MVFQSFRKLVYERRRGIATFAGFAGGLYLAGRYALRRLEEVREKFIQDKAAKENLRKRFLQNQEDCVFTAQALVPTLGNNILEALDVEALTHELQQQNSRTNDEPAAATSISGAQDVSPPGLDSSIITESSVMDLTPDFVKEPAPIEPIPESLSGSLADPMSESSASWVEQFTSSQLLSEEKRDASNGTSDSFIVTESVGNRPTSMSESMFSSFSLPESVSDSQSPPNVAGDGPRASEQTLTPPHPKRTKLQLWKEIRTTAFTRTITLIYCMTLLSLQTHIQLNILASHKYVQSILELEKEEKQEQAADSTFADFLLFGGSSANEIHHHLELGGGELDWGETDDDDYVDDQSVRPRKKILRVSDLTERKYLTLSWWLLNVGWKGVMNKVEKAVHKVFDSVPLKAMLSAEDVRKYVDLVRKEVDIHTEDQSLSQAETEELTQAEMQQLQGRPAEESTQAPELTRANFLSAILPLTPAAIQMSLTEGGLPFEVIFPSISSREGQNERDSFETLLEETKEFIESKDFELVLEKSLDAAFELLEAWIRTDIFEERESQGESGGDILEEEPKMKLAAILPGIARWGHQAVNSIPTELVGVVTGLREVSAFSAIIFSSFEDRMRS